MLIDVRKLSKKMCSHPIPGQLAYATKENFLGRIVKGYHSEAADLCLMTPIAAEQLCHVQNELTKNGFSLFIYDTFRPLRAVKDFAEWVSSPANDYENERQKIHFPHLKKEDLPRLGYIGCTVSRHCFGHVVDLSIIDLKTEAFLNMGTPFDYFDVTSHHDAKAETIGNEAFQNRQLLLQAMQQFEFMPHPYEWWHYEHAQQEVHEPMDMDIK